MEPYEGADLARAIDKVHVSYKDESLDGLIERLKSIEATFLPRYAGDAALVTETKRRVAEAIFLISTTKRAPFEVCRGYFDRLCELGFSTRGREFDFSAILARYALRCGRKASGIQLLERFVRQWKLKEQRPKEVTTRDMQNAAGLLRGLRRA